MMNKNEISNKLTYLQRMMEKHNDIRHSDFKFNLKENRECRQRIWELNVLYSMQHQEIDQLKDRVFMLETQIKEWIKNK